MPITKPLIWVASSKSELASMPSDVQDTFGYALHLAQIGDKHRAAKPLRGFGGAGVLEVVESERGNAYRAVYTVKIAGTVYVLHCFHKKSHTGRETPKATMDIINERLKFVLQHHEDATK